jgi:hypothetical protein
MPSNPKTETSPAELRQILNASRKFRDWRPDSVGPKSGQSYGRGKDFTSTGRTFKNQGEESEDHFTPQELATKWGLDPDTIRTLFADEPGVLVVTRPETRYKRLYRTFRIPKSVAARVHNRLSVKG